MKRHLQCMEQQASPSSFTKYCACHAKWISWLIRITYDTSLTMRRAARSHHPPTLPNTAPATQNECHDWSASHMKRHLQCAVQQASPSNLTKYCASHAKWISWLIRITYATSFTMREATGITLQPHQVLRQPRKMNLMIDPHHIWNVIYNAWSNRHHPPTAPNTAPATQMNVMIDRAYLWNVISNAQSSKSHPPTSPSTAPATQNESHVWSASHMKRHFQCAEQQASISNLTKYCAYHAKLHSQILEKLTENSWSGISNARPIRPWSDHYPTMIREWSDPENANRNPPRHQRGYFSHSPGADSIENYNVSRSGYHSKFHHMLHLPRKVTHELHQMLRLPQKMTHELHQKLRLPQKMTHELH